MCEVGGIIKIIRECEAAAEKVGARGVDRESVENAKTIKSVWDGADEIQGNLLRYFWPSLFWDVLKQLGE